MTINTEKLELPSISQVQTRGPADIPWFSSHYSQRPILTGDRLPDLHLPQSYVANTPYNSAASRIGSSDHFPTGQGNHQQSSHTSSYHHVNSEIGLKTPSPSPASQCSVPSIHDLPENTTESTEYSQPSQNAQNYSQTADHFSSTMNQQQQYLDSQQSQMPAGQSYPPSTTAGGMSQYSSYQHQQPPVLQPGPGNYAPSPAHYTQYGYPNGITSPQGPGHPVSSSMGPQMNSGLLPLPSKHTYSSDSGGGADLNSNGCRRASAAYIRRSAERTPTRLPTAECRYKWPGGSIWHEASSNSNAVGGRGVYVFSSRG